MNAMLFVLCNCKGCKHLIGSIYIGYLYADAEVELKGETNAYEFAFGSGFLNKAYFLKMQRAD